MTSSTGTLASGYTYTLKSPEKFTMSYYYMTVDLPYDVPDFFIDCKLNDLTPQKLLYGFSKKQQIKLEGGFADYYDTYTSEAEKLDFLSMFTPNIMYTIMKLGILCDIEFVDQRLELYWPFSTKDKAADPTNDILQAATALTQQLDRLLKRYNTIVDLKPGDESFSQAVETGSRLQDTGNHGTPAPSPYIGAVDTAVGILTLALAILITVGLFRSMQTAPENLVTYVILDIILAGVIVLLLVYLPYSLLIRKLMIRSYKRRLMAHYQATRQNLG
jgi:hypothetical protein